MRLLVIFLAVGQHDERWEMSGGRLAAFASTGPLRTQQRSCLRPARSAFATEELHKLMNLVAGREVLREEVGWVHISSDLPHLDCSRPDLLLHPESVSLQMPKFPSPDLVEIPIAALESVHTLAGVFSPKSSIINWWPKPAPAALTKQ